MTNRRLAEMLLLLTVAASAIALPPNTPSGRRRIVATAGADEGWMKYCGNLAMNGTPSGASAIHSASASALSLVWKAQLQGPIASSPSVFRTRIYVGDWSGRETALATADGSTIASIHLGQTNAPQCDPSTLGITSTPAIAGNHIYLAGGDDSFYALDAETLSVIWHTRLGDNSANGGYYGWSSPAVVGDTIIQGVASNCDSPFVPGRLVALDRNTGEETAFAGFAPDGKVGNGVWTSPAVDQARRKIFVTTGSGLDFAEGLGYSIVRIDLDTFVVEDSWKVSLDDSTWDADWGSSPTLFTDAAGRQLVGAGHKDGHYYAFDRNKLSAGPVWQAQVARSGEVPQAGDGTLSTAAFDGTKLYVGGGAWPDNDDQGSVAAIDPATGRILWRTAMPGPVIAPVSVVNDVVFAAGSNMIAALDASTGAMLWSYRTATLIYGGIAIAGDSLYVGDLSGKLYAFSLPTSSVRTP